MPAVLPSLTGASAQDIAKVLPSAAVRDGVLAFAFGWIEGVNLAESMKALRPGVTSSSSCKVTAPFTHADRQSFELLHKSCKRITKALCMHKGDHPYRLHPYITDADRALAGHAVPAQLLVSTNADAPEHVDRGLFNLVVGTATDLTGLQLEIRGSWTPVEELLGSALPDAVCAVLIPGVTLQHIWPDSYTAVPHRVRLPPRQGEASTSKRQCTSRTIIVFQWRLDKSFLVPMSSVLRALPSFRAPAQQPQAPAPPALALPGSQPVPPARWDVAPGNNFPTVGRVGSQNTGPSTVRAGTDNNNPLAAEEEPDDEVPFKVYLRERVNGSRLGFNVLPTTPVSLLCDRYIELRGWESDSARFVFNGRQVDRNALVADLGLRDGAVVDCFLGMLGD